MKIIEVKRLKGTAVYTFGEIVDDGKYISLEDYKKGLEEFASDYVDFDAVRNHTPKSLVEEWLKEHLNER